MGPIGQFWERIWSPTSRRPNSASVTSEKCSCGYLQRAAADPDTPIIFDDTTREYQFTYQEPECEGPSTLILYHCPFCGGAAPKSKRAQLFLTVPRIEVDRLTQILNPIRTMNDAIQLLGAPSFDGFSTSRTPERDTGPPTVQQHRTIQYKEMSDIADVLITESPDGRVFWHLQGKPRKI